MIQSLMPQQLLCAALEKIANQALAMNIEGTQRLAVLDLKTLTLHLRELNFPISLTFQAEKIIVTSLDSASDCSIHTSINSLMLLQKEQQLTELIKQDKLDINGDIKVAQQVAAIAEHLQIDWGSEISAHIGDYATYKLKQLGQGLAKKVKFAQQQISADSSEWLLHETRLVVTKSDIHHFNAQVNLVSQSTQALALRIDKLMQHINLSSSDKS